MMLAQQRGARAIRSGAAVAVNPRSQWEPLLSGTEQAGQAKRCRDCAHFTCEPGNCHGFCTLLKKSKVAYAGACASRVIAKALGKSNRNTEEAPVARPRTWTDADDAIICEYGHEGKEAVAKRLGKTVSAVKQRAVKLHVSLARTEISEPISVPEGTTDDAVDTLVAAAMAERIAPDCDIEGEADEFAAAAREESTTPRMHTLEVSVLDAGPVKRMLAGMAADLLAADDMNRDLLDELLQVRVENLRRELARHFQTELTDELMDAFVFPIVAVAERHGAFMGEDAL